jgi:hypothetical protein
MNNTTDTIYSNDSLLIDYAYSIVQEIDIEIISLKEKLNAIISCITYENIHVIKKHYLLLKRNDVKKITKKIKKFEEIKARIDFMSVVIPNMYFEDLSYSLDIIMNEIKQLDTVICNDVNTILKKINNVDDTIPLDDTFIIDV